MKRGKKPKRVPVILAPLILVAAISGLFSNGSDPDATKAAALQTTVETSATPEEETGEPGADAAKKEEAGGPGADAAKEGTSDDAGDSDPADVSAFEVHFLDVGQADAALVMCDGHYMLIDGGNANDSNLIYTCLKKQNVQQLDYIVCTHAHEDHVGGLPGALNYTQAKTVLCPVRSHGTKAFRNFLKYLGDTPITVPSVGDVYTLGSATFTILGPVSQTDETNDTSIVLRLVYGKTAFLFAGDAGHEEEHDILNLDPELKSTVLKVGHHGSSSSTCYRWLREIDPDYAVISVGKDNSYGHPADDLLSRLKDAGVQTYRTDLQGDIIFTGDGKHVHVTVTRNAGADTLSQPGNTGSSGASGTSGTSE